MYTAKTIKNSNSSKKLSKYSTFLMVNYNLAKSLLISCPRQSFLHVSNYLQEKLTAKMYYHCIQSQVAVPPEELKKAQIRSISFLVINHQLISAVL